jgi:hypothetical protein
MGVGPELRLGDDEVVDGEVRVHPRLRRSEAGDLEAWAVMASRGGFADDVADDGQRARRSSSTGLVRMPAVFSA